MDDTTTQIISIAGAVFGFVGMITGIGAVIYSRRQAIAAEGPQAPDIEVSIVSRPAPGWCRIEIAALNRTPHHWHIREVGVTRPKRCKIVPAAFVGYWNEDGEYCEKDVLKIETAALSNKAVTKIEISPLGQSAGDFSRERFLIYSPALASRISIRLILVSNASIVRERYIATINDEIPKTDIATP